MSEEEFYIWLLNCDSKAEILNCTFDSQFLKKYEIAKLVLKKIGTNFLSKNQQRNLNLEAVLAWLKFEEDLYLHYDIPEILELVPEEIKGSLSLYKSEIQCLPKLKSVVSWLNLNYSKVESLPELKFVGGDLALRNSEIQSLQELKFVGGALILVDSKIQSLPKLEYVGKSLNLQNSQIQSLPKLESVGKFIIIEKNNLNYWKNYFNETGRQELAKAIAMPTSLA